MDLLRRYLEEEKTKNVNINTKKSKLPKGLQKYTAELQDLDIDAFLYDYQKRHSPQSLKDATPKYQMTEDLMRDIKNYLTLGSNGKIKFKKSHHSRRPCLHSSLLVSPNDTSSYLPSLKSPSPLPMTIEDQEYTSSDEGEEETVEDATTQSEIYSA